MLSPPSSPHTAFLDDIPFMARPPPPPGKPGPTYSDLEEEPVYGNGTGRLWASYVRAVKDAFGAYEVVAFGRDELLRKSNVPVTKCVASAFVSPR